MTRQVLLAATILTLPTWACAQAPCPAISQSSAATASLHVSDGQIIWPTGQVFIAKGADSWAGQVIGSDPATLVTQTPDAGGGVNTVILNYAASSGQSPGAPRSRNNVIDVNVANEIQQLLSIPTPAPIASISPATAPTTLVGTGYIIVLPSLGTGEDVIRGTVRPPDRIDLTQVLSGTAWDHTASTIENHITTRSIGTGYVISIGRKVVALFRDGVSGNDITQFLMAN
jgi:hypothetical protein